MTHPDPRIDGLCAQTDPEAFFPEKGGSTKAAKTICGKCDVREQCLQYALDMDERFGIWGGLSERERRAIKKPTRLLVVRSPLILSTSREAVAKRASRARRKAADQADAA